jgi:hypothetical protein
MFVHLSNRAVTSLYQRSCHLLGNSEKLVIVEFTIPH